MVLAMIGLFIGIINYERDIREHKNPVNLKDYPNAMDHPRNSSPFVQVCRCIIVITTMISIVILFLKQNYRKVWLNSYFSDKKKSDPSQVELMHQEEEEDYIENEEDDDGADKDQDFGHGEHLITRQFLLEVAMLAIVPIPCYDRYIIMYCEGKDTIWFLSEFMLVIMFSRFYFLVKSMLNYTQFMDPYTKKVCKSYGFENSVLFTIKSNIEINPEATVSYIFILTLFVFAYIIRIFELPRFRLDGDDNFDSFFESIWLTVITLTTIGYGDVSPLTIPGKITTIILAFWGALIMALIVVVLYRVFDLSDDE